MPCHIPKKPTCQEWERLENAGPLRTPLHQQPTLPRRGKLGVGLGALLCRAQQAASGGGVHSAPSCPLPCTHSTSPTVTPHAETRPQWPGGGRRQHSWDRQVSLSPGPWDSTPTPSGLSCPHRRVWGKMGTNTHFRPSLCRKEHRHWPGSASQPCCRVVSPRRHHEAA